MLHWNVAGWLLLTVGDRWRTIIRFGYHKLTACYCYLFQATKAGHKTFLSKRWNATAMRMLMSSIFLRLLHYFYWNIYQTPILYASQQNRAYRKARNATYSTGNSLRVNSFPSSSSKILINFNRILAELKKKFGFGCEPSLFLTAAEGRWFCTAGMAFVGDVAALGN